MRVKVRFPVRFAGTANVSCCPFAPELACRCASAREQGDRGLADECPGALPFGAPADRDAVGLQPAGVVVGAADGGEAQVGRRRRLEVFVPAPAEDRAVDPQAAGVREPADHADEVVERHRSGSRSNHSHGSRRLSRLRERREVRERGVARRCRAGRRSGRGSRRGRRGRRQRRKRRGRRHGRGCGGRHRCRRWRCRRGVGRRGRRA